MEHELQIRKIGVGIITFSCHKIHFVSIRMVAQTRHSSSSRQLYQTPPAKNRIAAAADLISPEWFQPQMRMFIRFLLTKNILRLLKVSRTRSIFVILYAACTYDTSV